MGSIQIKEEITLYGSPEQPTEWIYRSGEDGVIVREATIDSGKGGDPVEIIQITDIHFNKLSVRDMIENDPSAISTFEQRGMCAYGNSILQLRACLEYARGFEQLVITGDTLDYLTYGGLDMLNTYVWQSRPDALVTLGNHDPVRVMGLPKDVPDPTPLEERYAILQRYWKHDIYYTSKVFRDKVMIVQMDNGQGCFWDRQVAPLARDLKTAREEGYAVLLFMHSPLCSRNPKESPLKTFGPQCAHDSAEFYQGGIGYNATGATKEIYDLIIGNADVVRGVFCGHCHSSIYSEILAQTADGEDAIIPQYVLNGTYTAPYVMKITVK